MKFNTELEERRRAGMMALWAVLDYDDNLVAVKLRWYGVGFFYRVDESWQLESPAVGEEGSGQFYEIFIDPDRAIEFLDKWDTQDSELEDELDFYKASKEVLYKYYPGERIADEYQEGPNAVVSAASSRAGCPPATQDIIVNTENRNKAIKSLGYGPLNPDRPNVDFWEEKAKLWQTTTDEAKTSRCANCAMFIKTPEMLECIESGISPGESDGWDSVDAGDLGYCESLDFKCAAGRTCDAWVSGGPVTGKDKEK